MSKQVRNNEFGQPVGRPVLQWVPRKYPDQTILEGNYCRLEKLDPERHRADLYKVYGPSSPEQTWTYLPMNAFQTEEAFAAYLVASSQTKDPFHYVVIDSLTNEVVGTLALMRTDLQQGSIEVGYVVYSDKLKKTRVATEAQYLLGSYVFEKLGYRRYEWKCDSLNGPSKKAAVRLGFTFEGVFRNALVYKERNRDTAWFSIIDEEWVAIKKRYENWLKVDNFDENGLQIKRLNEC